MSESVEGAGGAERADRELVRRAKEGDRAALALLVRRHVGSVRACVLAVLGRTPDLDDLVQEALLRGVERIGTLRDADRFGPWLRGIARHLALDRIRRKPPPSAPIDAVAEPAAPEDDPEADTEELWRAIEGLPETLREALHLFYVARLGYAEIGERLGITSAAVNRRLTRARQRLRERLTAHDAAQDAGVDVPRGEEER